MDSTELAAPDTAAARPPRTLGPWRVTDVLAVTVASAALLGVLSYIVRGAPWEEVYGSWATHNAPAGTVGLLALAAALRQAPGNRSVRWLYASSLLSGLHVAIYAAANALVADVPGVTIAASTGELIDLGAVPPLAGVLLWIGGTIWVPAGALVLLLALPTLPDGRWPSRAWRWMEPMVALGTASFAGAWAAYLWPGRDAVVQQGQPPQDFLFADVLLAVGYGLFVVTGTAAVVSLVIKLRRVDADQRRRLRPVGATAAAVIVAMIALYPWPRIWAVTGSVGLTLLVVTLAVGIVRHQLFDVDVLVSRAVTAAVLAAFVTLAYVGIVVGIGYVLGDTDNLVLALLATAVVAVAFEPLRRRVAGWARRLVLGDRATPAEVLGRLSDSLAGAGTAQDVLVQVAELLVAGTGAVRAEVRTEAGPGAVAGDLGAGVTATRRAPVVADGEQLGEVLLAARRPDLLLPADEALLGRVAALLGPVLRNAALADELQTTVDQLRASRQRLVLAEETVRRSVERDIHDGAQQQLLGLRLKLGLASALAQQGEVARLQQVVDDAAAATDEAIRRLRDLARGILPPVLQQEGLVAALRAHLREVPLEAVVDAPAALPRLDPGVEAACYLVCLEAVQNVTKHADARTVTVRLRHDAGDLHLAVVDDGRGLADGAVPGVGLQSIADRIEALGGAVTLTGAPGAGTTVSVRVPVPAVAPQSTVGGSPVSAR